MNTILREPLLHFLLLGGALFAAYGLVSNRSSDEPEEIVISAGQVAAMAEGFVRSTAASAHNPGNGRIDP